METINLFVDARASLRDLAGSFADAVAEYVRKNGYGLNDAKVRFFVGDGGGYSYSVTELRDNPLPERRYRQYSGGHLMYYGNPLDLSFEVDGHYYRVWDTRKDGASKTAERVNILELMQKYNMTLRCFPTHEVYQTDYREGRPLGEGETIVEVQLKEFPSGKPVIVKRVRHEVFHEPKWGVKVGANQWPNWQKSDFYGTTAEEAIMKAVNHINNKSND